MDNSRFTRPTFILRRRVAILCPATPFSERRVGIQDCHDHASAVSSPQKDPFLIQGWCGRWKPCESVGSTDNSSHCKDLKPTLVLPLNPTSWERKHILDVLSPVWLIINFSPYVVCQGGGIYPRAYRKQFLDSKCRLPSLRSTTAPYNLQFRSLSFGSL
jgi:hypothetical protein